MKVLLAAAGLVFAMMCFALVVVVEVLARLLPVLILAVLLWGGWRIWQARRSRLADTAVPLLAAPFPAPAPVATRCHSQPRSQRRSPTPMCTWWPVITWACVPR